MIATHLLCIILGFDGVFSRIDGAILFGSFIAYNAFLYFDERKYYKEEMEGLMEKMRRLKMFRAQLSRHGKMPESR